ncbi:ABC transporter permease [Candidatus Pacearchaeota archaeon]|nr:ABC transporter permease [Candidatus Pacearchaeota archaeon]
MKMRRVNALLIRHLYLYKRSVPRLMDIFYWPIVELLLWGFLSIYLSKLELSTFNAVTLFLGAIIFWDLLAQSQRAVSVAFLEDVWEKNLLNIFITPLKISEFLASTVILGFVKIILVAIVMSILAFLFYAFNIFDFGLSLIPFFINLLIFGWTLGLFTTAIILRYGTSAQVLAFGFIVLIQPFTAVFYPVSALPQALQYISYLFPSTYVFEGLREVANAGSFPGMLLLLAFLTNIIYLALVTWFFYGMFAWIKRKGRLMKLND